MLIKKEYSVLNFNNLRRDVLKNVILECIFQIERSPSLNGPATGSVPGVLSL